MVKTWEIAGKCPHQTSREICNLGCLGWLHDRRSHRVAILCLAVLQKKATWWMWSTMNNYLWMNMNEWYMHDESWWSLQLDNLSSNHPCAVSLSFHTPPVSGFCVPVAAQSHVSSDHRDPSAALSTNWCKSAWTKYDQMHENCGAQPALSTDHCQVPWWCRWWCPCNIIWWYA